uniref:Uncharacterized protein n=1 Tax=Ixodes ricinus TaxID=34613 RepID=A0A6B0USA2_IXORI
MDPPVTLCGMLCTLGQVCEVPAEPDQGGASGLCAILRGAPATDVHERHARAAPLVARAAGNQVQKAPDAAHHLHGRQHQNPPGRLCHHGEGALRPAVGKDRPQGPVRVLALHCPLRQGVVAGQRRGACDGRHLAV